MTDPRRIVIIFVIAVLFSLFVNLTIEAIYPEPDRDDFCEPEKEKPHIPYPEASRNITCPQLDVTDEIIETCEIEKGYIDYVKDKNNCPIEAYCETCQRDLDESREEYNLIVFIVSTILGFIAIVAGLNLPVKKNLVNDWVGSGFLLGGLLTIFIGTARFFGDMGRTIRPIVILLELILVIYLTYKKLGKKK